MPDEAKKLNFFNTKVDHVMHKLPADYVINLGYTNQNRLLDLQRPSFVASFMDNYKNLLREFWGDTYSFVLMDIVWIYMDIMKLMPITTRQDLVADVFFQRTAVAKSLAIL